MSSTSEIISSPPLSLFILNNLPPESSFGLDTKQWTVAKFNGVKNIPPGLHLFSFSASPNKINNNNLINQEDTISRGIGIKHGLFKFFSFNKSETLLEEWDNISEELISDSNEEIWSIKRKRRIKTTTTTRISTKDSSIEEEPDELEEEVIISPDYLKSLDKTLAAYPINLQSEWITLTSFITPRTILRVIGIDARGNSRVDASMGTNLDVLELREAGKKSWGKEREEERNESIEKEEREKEIIREEVLEFLKIEEKRTWPKGAVGSELTKWSKDKSWYLSSIIFDQLGKGGEDIQEYLAELQLSFVLFVLLHNFSSLTIYKSLFTLLCQSPSLLYPLSSLSNPPNPALIQTPSLPLFKSFLTLFKLQLNFLEDTFFSTELPDLETFFLDQLGCLQINLIDAGREWELINDTTTTTTTLGTSGGEIDQSGAKLIWNLIISEWDEILTLSMKKFGWNLESINLGSGRRRAEREKEFFNSSSSTTTTTIVGAGAGAEGGGSRRVRDEDEIDLEDLEEGDDAPQIVEM